MAWAVLFVAGIFEIAFVMSLGHPGSFKRLWPTLSVFFFGVFSVYLLAVVMRSLPVGTAFAIWAAIGAGGATMLGILFRGEPANLLRLAGLVTVIGGAVVLRLAEG
jgi:quaternary ammonium compound-resistance protein SugE